MDAYEINERLRKIQDAIEVLIDDVERAAQDGAPENDGLLDDLRKACSLIRG